MKFIAITVFTLSVLTCFSQNSVKFNNKKGEFFFYWGWNREWFSKSDINFSGESYNFNLKRVVATDKQSPFSINKYFNPTQISIPQYNFRIGYFFHRNWAISVGIDHMKYVVQPDQHVSISGYINDNQPYEGIYQKDDIILKSDFLLFEHTDGLNFINIELTRFDRILNIKNISINLTEGIDLGPMVPRTNTTLLSKKRYDEFHLSGYGIGLLVGLNVTFFEHLFIQSEFKNGFINMPDIRTTQYKSDHASQSFYFSQINILFGGIVRIKKNEKET